MKEDGIALVDYDPARAREIVQVWRDSKRQALGAYTEPHDFENFFDYLTTKLAKSHQIKLAIDTRTDRVVGFMAVGSGWIDQIYIHNDHQHRGIGSRLLQIAKQMCPEGLELYTFQCNKPAQAFYEKHGFSVLAYGTENEENLPDILYKWTGGVNATQKQ